MDTHDEHIIDIEEIESITTEEEPSNFCENMHEDDFPELISHMYELIDEYLQIEMLKMSNPSFHKDLIEDISSLIFQNLVDANLCNESDYDQLYELVSFHSSQYFENRIHSPLRCIPHYKGNYHCDHFRWTPDKTASYMSSRITELRKINEQIPKQRTPEWYQRRYNMMTASNLWQALNTESQRNRLIYEKCKPLDFGHTEHKWVNTENSLHWGVKYEPVTAMIYQKMIGAFIEDFGCIQHEKYPFLGASPDGIVTDPNSIYYGRMLEIKNIYNREMDGIPSEAYWIQMQIQLECCNLDVCDFVETRFKTFENEEAFYSYTGDKQRGIILHFIIKTHKSNVPLYKYMPLDIPIHPESISKWIQETKNENEEFVLYSTIYWYLEEMIMTTVERNRQWFQAALPIIEDTWKTIEIERVSGYEHRAPKKKVSPTDVIIVDPHDGTESHIIKNMPANSGKICLIKINSTDSNEET